MFPAWYMTFYYGNSSRFQFRLHLQLTQANHIMKATNFNYDHYNKTLERSATTRRPRSTTTKTTGTATRRRRATAALMGKLPWLMPQTKNSFSRVKVITIYRPQKSVAQHKSKWTRQAQTPSLSRSLSLPCYPLPLRRVFRYMELKILTTYNKKSQSKRHLTGDTASNLHPAPAPVTALVPLPALACLHIVSLLQRAR